MEHLEEHHDTMTKKKIWRVFFILLFITILEFILALAIPENIMAQGIKNMFYVIMTIMKAFYIVAYFMHLKFEKKSFQIMLLGNTVIMIFFIVLLLIEGSYIALHS